MLKREALWRIVVESKYGNSWGWSCIYGNG